MGRRGCHPLSFAVRHQQLGTAAGAVVARTDEYLMTLPSL
jgi:hypothetical protein